MNRAFPFTYQERTLEISVTTVDEGWELWVWEGNRKVAFAAHVSLDEAVERARRGEDLIQIVADRTKQLIRAAELNLPPPDSESL